MAWIESHQTLDNHPKLLQACATLKIGKPQMIGHLHLLWHWCMDYAVDGDLTRYKPQQIATVCGWEYDPETFILVLLECGFLDKKNKGYEIHDWLDFCGEIVMKRIERLGAKRRKTAEFVGTSAENSAKFLPTQPYRTVPNRTKPTKRAFVRPSAAEVTAYGASIGFRIDGSAFCDFYESKAWKVGNTPMKSWQAAVRNWMRREGREAVDIQTPPLPPPPAYAEIPESERMTPEEMKTIREKAMKGLNARAKEIV